MIRAKKRYNDFHGRSVDRVKNVDFENPKQLVYLGRAVELTYESDKLNGGGDGEITHFVHEFENEVIVATDEKGKQLYLIGDGLKITHKGIEG